MTPWFRHFYLESLNIWEQPVVEKKEDIWKNVSRKRGRGTDWITIVKTHTHPEMASVSRRHQIIGILYGFFVAWIYINMKWNNFS